MKAKPEWQNAWPATEEKNRRSVFSKFGQWPVAAFLLLLLLAIGSLYWYLRPEVQNNKTLTNSNTYKEFVNTTGKQAAITLTDGTRIWLNVQSRIKYPEPFTPGVRTVFLTGEAFFDVAHDTRRPFMVQTRHLVAKVTGTSFQVKAYPDEPQAQVTVATGRVIVKKEQQATAAEVIILSPNQRVTLHKNSGRLNRDVTDLTEALALTKNELYLRDMSFAEIARKLERWYGVTVFFKNSSLKSCEFSATFKQKPLAEVLSRLQLTANFKYEIKGNQVYIDGKACD